MTTKLPILSYPNEVLGDTFGFNVAFPYNINGHEVSMTLKKNPATQTDAQADAKVAITPVGVTPDANGNYNVLLTIQTNALALATTYFFDIVDKDTIGNVSHIIDPSSTVNFKQSVTTTP